MKKWIMRAHMYAGLMFFGFLMVFATSALLFNHKPQFLEDTPHVFWQQSISTTPQAEPYALADAVRQQLGVAGRNLHPAINPKTGDLDFDIARPGRRYTVHLSNGVAHVDETEQGWAATLTGLHGVRPTTNSFFLNAWAWYSAIGALALAGSALTGVLIWAIRPRERVLGFSILGAATAVSLAICFYIRIRG